MTSWPSTISLFRDDKVDDDYDQSVDVCHIKIPGGGLHRHVEEHREQTGQSHGEGDQEPAVPLFHVEETYHSGQ